MAKTEVFFLEPKIWGFHLAHFHLAFYRRSGESSPFVAGDYTQAARDKFAGQEQNLTSSLGHKKVLFHENYKAQM